MRNGINGDPLPSDFPYAGTINTLCVEFTCSPALVGAIKMNETGLGQGDTTNNVVSSDGGHGIMQLTSSYPLDWNVPASNITWAIRQFILQAWTAFAKMGEEGDDLVRCIAAAYNEGLGTAIEAHDVYGNVDEWDTDQYGARALAHYHAIIGGTWNA